MTSIVIRKPNSQGGLAPVTGRMRFTPMRHFDAAKNLVIAGGTSVKLETGTYQRVRELRQDRGYRPDPAHLPARLTPTPNFPYKPFSRNPVCLSGCGVSHIHRKAGNQCEHIRHMAGPEQRRLA